MGLFKAFDIAASGMSVEQAKMDATSHNIAYGNIPNSRRWQVAVGQQGIPEFAQFLPSFLQASMSEDLGLGTGVTVAGITEIDEQTKYVYDPDNPTAIKEGKWKGYVAKSSINIIEEMTNLIAASRAYEANATVINASKDMAMKAIDIGRNM